MRSPGRRFKRWLMRYSTPEIARRAEELPLRRDMVTLLQYVQENKVVGTRSTGNMPLKAVREVTARFVNPPELDQHIGDRVYRLRSEAEVRPLYFLHILAEVGGFLQLAPAQRWQVTAAGTKFLSLDPLLQVSCLLDVWWRGVNWLVVCPFGGLGDSLPDHFERTTLRYLRSLPVGKQIEFEDFADKLIEKTGLTWPVGGSYARMFLHAAVQWIVVDVLAKFGVLEPEYIERPIVEGAPPVPRLVAFEVTPFGRALLEKIATLDV